MPVFNNILAGAAGSGGAADYKIERSLRFNDDDSAYLSRTPTTAGNRKKWTWSGWVKRTTVGDGNWRGIFTAQNPDNSNRNDGIWFDSNDRIYVSFTDSADITFSPIYRDTGAWMHVFVSVNTDATSDKIKCYVNGVQLSIISGSQPSSGAQSGINNATRHSIGRRDTSTNQYLEAYLADVHFLDGTTISNPDGVFGEFDAETGVWNPIEYTGNYNFGTAVTHWRQATGADNPASNTTGNISHRPFKALTDPQTSSLIWDHQNTQVFGLQNITGITSLRLLISSRGSAKLGINTGSMFSIGSIGGDYNNAQSQAAWYTVNNPPSELTSIAGTGGGSSTSNFCSIWGIEVNGTRVIDINAGVHGFHLDFSDNSSNAALGFDANVEGHRYSADWSGTLATNYTFATLFDGDVSTLCLGTNGATLTWTPSTPIAWTDAAGGVEVYYHNTSSPDKARVNGGSWVNQANNSGGWEKVTTGDGTLTKLELADQAGSEVAVYAIRVNGTILTNPAGANDWTANNIALQASTYAVAGTHSGKPGISFNGTNAEINISSDADVNPGSGEFTFECYAYSNSASSEFGIYDGSPGGAGSLVIRRVSSGTLMVERHNQAFDITGGQFSQNTWHHVAVTRDSSNNVRLFVDGSQSGSTSTNNTQNYSGLFRLGRTNNVFTQGYISSLRLIKGTCLYTSNFSPPSGPLGDVTNTKLLMAQSTTSATAATVKPSGVTITGAGDSSVIDSFIDSPTDYEADSGNNGGNYCTLNPLDLDSATLSNGNLEAQVDSSGSNFVRGTIAVSSGKWYFEYTVLQSNNMALGVVDVTGTGDLSDGGSFYYYVNGGTLFGQSSGKASSYGSSTLAVGDTLGVALDMDAGTLKLYKNGSYLNNTPAWTGLTGRTLAPAIGTGGGSNNRTAFNAGQRPFANTPPTGYVSLCTQNLPDPLIADPSIYFDVDTWSGDNSDPRQRTLSFGPDLVWIKTRNQTNWHSLTDSVRGAPNKLYSNSTNAEDTAPIYGQIDSLNSDGFTLGGGTDSSNPLSDSNQSGTNYVAWAWDGGDLVTNSAYNQSEEWSSKLSTYQNSFGSEPVINLFDGDTSTNFFSSTTSGSGIKFVPATAITGSIELYLRNGDTSNSTFSYSLDNGSTFTNLTTTGGNGSYVSIGSQTISNTNGIIVRHVTTAGTNSVNWRAIRVDNKVLVDPGVVSIASLNSAVYNTSQNWSVAGSNMQNNWSASFDGDTDPHFALPNTGYSASMTFPNAISYQTLELVVARDIYAPDLLMNGNALNVPATDTNTTSGRYKIERLYFTNGTLTSIGHETRNTAGRGGSGFWQIIVDGKILVDTNQASNVTNVPSITTKCSSNPAAGFAISTYKGNSTDGATIATNLGSTPEMVIVKARDKSDDWRVYHVGAGNPYYLRLQLSNNKSGTNNWREMSLNYFALDADSAVNSSSHNYVAYSFSSVPGYSAIGSYEANSTTNGPFVFTGFKPAFLMVKNIDDTQHSSAYNWTIVDTARYPFNETGDLNALYANSTANEDTYPYGGASTGINIDILSNGFKLRSGSAEINHGNTYIYYAVAENPFKYARAR